MVLISEHTMVARPIVDFSAVVGVDSPLMRATDTLSLHRWSDNCKSFGLALPYAGWVVWDVVGLVVLQDEVVQLSIAVKC